jgi:hypothetical protein
MNKLQEIKTICKKSPLILNMFIRFYNEDKNISIQKVKWLHKMWNQNKIRLSSFFVNYNQIKKIEEFEKLIQEISSSIYKINVEKENLLDYLSSHDKDYQEKNNNILVKIQSWQETKLLGSPQWCIVKNEKDYNDYMAKNESQYIIFIYGEDNIMTHRIGFMTNDEMYVEGYDESNNMIMDYYRDVINGFNICSQEKVCWPSPVGVEYVTYRGLLVKGRVMLMFLYGIILSLFLSLNSDNFVASVLVVPTMSAWMFLFYVFMESEMGLNYFLHKNRNNSSYSYNPITGNVDAVTLDLMGATKRPNIDVELTMYTLFLFVPATVVPFVFSLF